VVCSVAKVDLAKLIKVTVPFLLMEIAALMTVIYFPKIALFIPHLFGFRYRQATSNKLSRRHYESGLAD
jgi:hypothetical protein